MTLQAFGYTLNLVFSGEEINLTLAAITLIVGIGIGNIWGWFRGQDDATTRVQHALDWAARDLRLYRENIYGVIPKSPPAQALREAEQIVRWRTAPDNIESSPQGISRLTPPGIPRSRSGRHALARTNQRALIEALGRNQRPDDTYAHPLREQVGRRYTCPPERWETVDAEAT